MRRTPRAAGELRARAQLFAVDVVVRDLSFASRAAALIASERARATTTISCVSFTRGSERQSAAGLYASSASVARSACGVLRSTSAPPSLVNVTLALRAAAANGALALGRWRAIMTSCASRVARPRDDDQPLRQRATESSSVLRRCAPVDHGP
jgi:hypothetical protein